MHAVEHIKWTHGTYIFVSSLLDPNLHGTKFINTQTHTHTLLILFSDPVFVFYNQQTELWTAFLEIKLLQISL